MRVQRWLFFTLVLLFSAFYCFAQNAQTLFPANSAVYEYLRVISSEQKTVPSIAEKPASKERILYVLDKIEFEKLSPSAQQLYRKLLAELSDETIYNESEDLAADFSVLVNLENYLQLDTEHVEWYKSDASRKPFLTFPFEFWFYDTVYSRIEIPIKKEPFLHEELPKHNGNWTNAPLDLSQIDFQFPYVAYLAAGGEHWNVQLGRGKLEYGSGRTGNFLIGSDIPYYSFFRAKTFWEAFSLFYTTIDLEPWETGAENISNGITEDKKVQRILFSHGFMLNFIPRLRIIVKESSLITDFDPTLNYLNPLMVFHNWYLDTTNSFLTLDAELNVWRGINLYGVLAIDQLQTFFELQRYNATTIPNAYGYLLGAEVSLPQKGGYWLGNVEWVYTNPWLYIHEVSNASFIWTGHIESHVEGSYYKHLPLGYPSGPDSMNLFANLGFTKPQSYKVSCGYAYKVKGTHNVVETVWAEGIEEAGYTTPTGIAEVSHAGWLEVSWYPSFFPPLQELGTGLAYTAVQNEANLKGQDYHELQWSIYVSLEF